MLLSEIGDKIIIDISTGTKLGELWDGELIFDEDSGKIYALVLPIEEHGFPFTKTMGETTLPWSSIVKIGESLILFESEY